MVNLEKGIYCNADNYVVYYGFRRAVDILGCTWHVAPPPQGNLRGEDGELALRWKGGAYVLA